MPGRLIWRWTICDGQLLCAMGINKLWTALGASLDKKGDTAGALTALTEAEARAPFYARPTGRQGYTTKVRAAG